MSAVVTMRCHFDGACEPMNPGGNMGIGAFAAIEENELFTYSEFILAAKRNSNNVAEYKGFIAVAKFLIEYIKTNIHSVERIDIRGDSNLVIQQLNGNWRIKQGYYTDYAKYAKLLFLEITALCNAKKIQLSLKWVPRTMNGRADELSKKGMVENNCEFRIQKQ